MSWNVLSCVGAAGELFIDTSASKCPSYGALLGASRKMNCKESGCLVHIKTIHRLTQAERQGPSYDPTSAFTATCGRRGCALEKYVLSIWRKVNQTKKHPSPSVLSGTKWQVGLDFLPSLHFLGGFFCGSLRGLGGIVPDSALNGGCRTKGL